MDKARSTLLVILIKNIYTLSDPDQEYIYFMVSDPDQEYIYFMGSESSDPDQEYIYIMGVILIKNIYTLWGRNPDQEYIYFMGSDT